MTENIFDAGEIIDGLNKRLYDSDLDGDDRSEIIFEHTKAIIQVTVYERETAKFGKCCQTCETELSFTKKHCEECYFEGKNWRPRITKATFGLEE